MDPSPVKPLPEASSPMDTDIPSTPHGFTGVDWVLHIHHGHP